MAEYIPIAELLATLDLDSSGLTEGLENARIKLGDIRPEIITANALLKQMEEIEGMTALTIEEVAEALQKEFELRQLMALATREFNETILASEKAKREQTMLLAKEQSNYEKELLAGHREQVESDLAYENSLRKEYASMAAEYAQEEAMQVKQSLADQTAARQRYTAIWSILLRQQEEAQEATARQIALSPIGRQIAEAQAGATAGATAFRELGTASDEASGKIVVNSFRDRTAMQAVNEMLGTRIPSSIARLVAYGPEVQALMSKLFDVVMVGAFIDILYHVSERIQQIITDYEGFDKASIKAWGHAQQGAQDAAKYLLEYNKMQTEVSEAGLKGANLDKAKQRDKDIEIEQIKKLIHSKKEEMGVLGEFLDKVKAENDTILPHEAVSLGKYITGGHSFIDEMKLHGDTIDSLTEKYYKAQEAVSAYGKELARAEVDRAKDLVKESREPDKTTKRRIPGAEDHEEPNRLPWYLGPNAAEHFRDQLGGPKSLHGLPSASMTGGKIGSNFGGGGDESTGNKVVEVHTTIAPNFVFHGVPADVQAFMRNEAYPILSADLQNDIRGIKTAVREAVENSRG